MRIASWSWGGRLHAGTVSRDGREATPLAVVDASRGLNIMPTPEGTPPKWLGPGDAFRVEIDGMGAIENRFEYA
jgi:2-keto-4-pentenoate hydratase/2-oxohepta-3-ene-1,7-dioic acid hydratase in catechol pathway